MNKERILFTGANSLLAMQVIPLLIEKGFNITGINRSQKSKELPIKYFIGDMNDKLFLDNCFHNIDTIIHAAGATRTINSEELFSSNEKITKSLVDAAIKNNIKKFIFISSDLAAYRCGSYGKSKSNCESIIKSSALNDWYLLRLPPLLTSTRELNSTLSKLIDNVQKGNILFLPQAGNFKINYINPTDIVKTIISINNSTYSKKSILNDLGKSQNLNSFLKSYTGKPTKIFNIPIPILSLILSIIRLLRIDFLQRESLTRIVIDFNKNKKQALEKTDTK